jgi:hypothetical protein
MQINYFHFDIRQNLSEERITVGALGNAIYVDTLKDVLNERR